MKNSTFVEKVVNLYFNGYSVEEALKLTKDEHKQEELSKIAEAWENKAKKEPVVSSKGWKYQQPRLV